MTTTLSHTANNAAKKISYSSAFSKTFETIRVQQHGAVALVTLHRPRALNALNSMLMQELTSTLHELDGSNDVGAIVLTGSDKAFAAGADIKEMKDREFVENYNDNYLVRWHQISQLRKPVIAAVNGYALGGGCELALMCDIIYAGPKARFGQPEIKLGTIPGAGGTQRLLHAVGKSKAMEMVLAGTWSLNGEEACKYGLASRVFDNEQKTVDAALELGAEIASRGRAAVLMAKEAVNAAFEMPLQQGLQFERRLFHSTFATKDQKEGMAAFAEKREPKFSGK